MTVAPVSDLAIDLYLPGTTNTASPLSMHAAAYQTNYISETGNHAGSAKLPTVATIRNWFLLSRVEVEAPGADGTIVAFGDSITDGAASTADTNRRWPDVLASRLLVVVSARHELRSRERRHRRQSAPQRCGIQLRPQRARAVRDRRAHPDGRDPRHRHGGDQRHRQRTRDPDADGRRSHRRAQAAHRRAHTRRASRSSARHSRRSGAPATTPTSAKRSGRR